MKNTKSKPNNNSAKQSSNKSTAKHELESEAPETQTLLDDEDTGFGGWLKSADGLDTMKLFVIANSVVMVTTLAFPHIQTVVNIIYEIFYGPESLY